MKKKRVAVLIPCYNESETIAEVVKDFKGGLPDASIYVYDNGSTDDTSKVARRVGAIVKKETKRGKGNVIRAMFRDIEADCYVVVDGDGSHVSNGVSVMCDAVLNSGVDMVIGDRLSSNYFDTNKRTFHNVGNRLIRSMVNRLFGGHIKDVMSGYRVLSRKFVKDIPIRTGGFEVETEMTIWALKNHYIIKEVPIPYKERQGGKSEVRAIWDGARIIKEVLREKVW